MSIDAPVAGDTKIVKQFGYTVSHVGGGAYYPIVDSLPGWTGEAISRSMVPNAATADFYLPVANVGAIVGLYAGNPNSYTSLTHALYGAAGVLKVMESGVVLAGSYTYTNADKLTIKVNGGQVLYQKNGTTFYTSTVAPSGVGRNVVTFLYAAGDSVWNLVITSLATGTQNGTVSVLLAPLFAVGGVKRVTSSTLLAPLTVTGGKLLKPAFSNAMVQLYPVISSGSSNRSASFSSTMLRPLFATGSDVATYSYSNAKLAPLTVSGITLTNYLNGYTVSQVVYATDSYIGAYSNVASYTDTVVATDVVSASIVLFGSYVDQVVVTDQVTAFSGLRGTYVDNVVATDAAVSATGMFGLISDVVRATDLVVGSATLFGQTFNVVVATDRLTGAPSVYDVYRTWVVNEVDDPRNNPSGYASTRYESYDFTSFARFNDAYYGIRADGIYLLEGDDDHGAQIAASIDYGLVKMSKDSTFVRMPAAYIGVNSTGRMLMRVTFQNDTYTYRSRNDRTKMKMQRFDFGKGLKANFAGIELLNEQGADFDINSVELTAVSLSRRI